MKYEKIASEILKYIEDKEFIQGDKLPSISDLVEEYQVGKNTVIKALELLESSGIIYQVRGSGIFVRGHKRKGYINLVELQGFNSMLRDFKLTSNVLEVKLIKPTMEIMENLNIEGEEEVYYIKRQRYIQGRIFCVEESYYKKSVVPFLNEAIVGDSIFQYLTENLDLKIGFVDHFLRIIKLKQDSADLLDLEEQDPGILVESIYHLNNGEAFDYSKITYHYQEAQFFVQGNSHYSLL